MTGASTGDPKVRDAALMSKNDERDPGVRAMMSASLEEERMLWSCCLRGTLGVMPGSPFCPLGTHFSCTILYTGLFGSSHAYLAHGSKQY